MMFSLVLYSGDMLSTGLKLRPLITLASHVRPTAAAKMGMCLEKGVWCVTADWGHELGWAPQQ